MMYHNKFVAAIKVGGKVLRESSNVVTLPFGAEYSILLKNLNSVRVLAKVTVDGQDATDGTKLIIAANASVELERFIRNGNLQSGNRFKFIERTDAIEEHRGIKADDGLVRVEFWTEQVTRWEPRVQWVPVQRLYDPVYPAYPTIWNSTTTVAGGVLGGAQSGVLSAAQGSALTANCNNIGLTKSSVMRTTSLSTTQSFGDAGITVPGSESTQKFVSGSWFPTEAQSDVLVLQLRGEIGGQPVQRAVTVTTKPKCITCGKTNKATAKFCSRCGTSLQAFGF
jgi:hypothetical protein